MTGITFSRHSGEQALGMLEEIMDLYVQIHSGAPEYDYEMYSKASFISRTSGQALKAGFTLITARVDSALVGFSFGYPFSPGQWWSSTTPPRPEIREATKFAVIELDVRESHRLQGIGGKLLAKLLEDRPEHYATLVAIPDSLAHGMYVRRGWYKAGTFTKAPVMDALVFPLAA